MEIFKAFFVVYKLASLKVYFQNKKMFSRTVATTMRVSKLLKEHQK